MDAKRLTVRAGSPYHMFLGSVHNVKGGYYHMMYDEYIGDYDVAVLWVCSDFDIPVDRVKCVTCLW
jgi:hypothetical protein